MTASGKDRRVILVTRRTRLEELVARHNTLAQAKFYLEHLGANFSDYLKENEAYAASLRVTVEALEGWGRYQVVDRSLLANFVFAPTDIVVALGQDGLVANTLKYLLDGQPLMGVNPEPARWDGILLPFLPAQLPAVLPQVAADKRDIKLVTMAEARLSDGQGQRPFRWAAQPHFGVVRARVRSEKRDAVLLGAHRFNGAGLNGMDEEHRDRLARDLPRDGSFGSGVLPPASLGHAAAGVRSA